MWSPLTMVAEMQNHYIYVLQVPHMIFPLYLHTLYLRIKCAPSFPHKSYMFHTSHPQTP